ncbi:MAG: hypothetical protein P8182_00890 [Deltaproteobacteria bacterium]
MRIARVLLTAVILALAAAFILGCVPGIKSVKPAGETNQTPAVSGGVEEGAPAAPEQATKGEEEKAPSATVPYKPPPPPSEAQTGLGAIDLRLKDEVNEAALKFAKNVSGVIHVKTCYSKLYGGWYLFLYLKKGKKISLQQYSWNDKTKEWEIIYQLKELPPERLEYHLKGEVDDEKCFILK